MSTKIEVLSSPSAQTVSTSGQHATVDLQFSLHRKQGVMVPLGIPNVKNQPSDPYFHFNYSIIQQAATTLIFEVRNVTGQLYYQSTIAQAYLQPGHYRLLWDGFDLADTFDSRCFNHKPLKASLIVSGPQGSKTHSVFLTTRYQVVSWLDLLISRSQKRINITLRTNFKDGGAAAVHHQDLPTDDGRTKSFEELLLLAQDGLQYYWSRNQGHPVGKNIVLADGNAYEVFVEAINTPVYAIKTPKIVYQSNARLRRSRNWELSRILFYNTGNLRHAKKWYTKKEAQANADYKLIAAHEIGHEILLAYGGHIYSKSHKGSSTILTQRPLGNYLYPAHGEIDLMLYYASYPKQPVLIDIHQRTIASETDVKSLIWLAQIAYQLV
ncbi:hypothetical protein IWX76_000514 [Pedobacter sp. CAN_A7]|uniref:hypothetical protein n=1 Tax=Pedobacter sp. CAN_A7 TaxID=2787722 RepID=UPI0018CAFAAD